MSIEAAKERYIKDLQEWRTNSAFFEEENKKMKDEHDNASRKIIDEWENDFKDRHNEVGGQLKLLK